MRLSSGWVRLWIKHVVKSSTFTAETRQRTGHSNYIALSRRANKEDMNSPGGYAWGRVQEKRQKGRVFSLFLEALPTKAH